MDKRRDKYSFQVLTINGALRVVDLKVMIARHVEGIVTCTAIGVDTMIKRSKQLLAAEASRVYCHENGKPDGWSMMRTFLALISAVGLGLSLIISSDAAHALTLRWFGHAFFLVTSSDGVRVAMDVTRKNAWPNQRSVSAWAASDEITRLNPKTTADIRTKKVRIMDHPSG